jgi:putative drug exporter of the RND superfamily
MFSSLSPRALARSSAEHPKRVIWIWVAILFASFAIIGTLLSDVLSPAQSFVTTPESQKAANQIEQITGTPDAVVEQAVVATSIGTFSEPARRQQLDALTARFAALGPEVVVTALSPTSNPAYVSKDGRTAVIPIVMAGSINDARDNIEKVLDTAKARDGKNGLDIKVTGLTSIETASNLVAENDLKVGETIGIIIGLVILAFVFGALVSALLPLMLAIAAIIVALALTALVGQFGDLSFFVSNMITMMGLAVGIDYALFIVSRYREERAIGVAKLDAIERAGDTSSRAVFFSGITVVVALISLLIVPMSVFISLGLGAILAVLAAVAAALTLLPALLSLLGDRIEKGRLIPRRKTEDTRTGFWAKVVTWVMKRPVASLVVAAGLLIAASLPYWGITTGASGVQTLPPDIEARQAFEVLQKEFNAGALAPARIPIQGDTTSSANTAEIDRITAAVAGDDTFGTPFLEPGAGPNGGVLNVPITVDYTSPVATDAVERLRAATELPVGGATSLNIDYFDISSRYLPIVVVVVLALSFLVLLLAFRSIVVPIVAIILNLLSVGAAFGLVTLVFQKGYATGFFGFQQVDTIEAWIPIFLFAVLFGLSMDYHVFLLSRIRERFIDTKDNVASITHGISSSGRLITGAALIMVAVFGGFAAGDLVMFQQMGFGLGVAVLIDATLVRGVLLPAIMRLLGNANWYLPKALHWIPDVAIEGPGTAPVAAALEA